MICFILWQCVSNYEASGLAAGERNAARAKGEELILERKRQEALMIFLSKITNKSA